MMVDCVVLGRDLFTSFITNEPDKFSAMGKRARRAEWRKLDAWRDDPWSFAPLSGLKPVGSTVESTLPNLQWR